MVVALFVLHMLRIGQVSSQMASREIAVHILPRPAEDDECRWKRSRIGAQIERVRKADWGRQMICGSEVLDGACLTIVPDEDSVI